MWIIGCDYHPSFQQIAFVNQATGEYGNQRLEHKSGEAEQFYRKLAGEQYAWEWRPRATCDGLNVCWES